MVSYFPRNNFNKVVVSGGGSNSQLWCQIISNVMNVQVVSLKQKEASAIGAIIAAIYGAGVYSDIENAIKNITTLTVRANPESDYVKYYSGLFEIYKFLYTQTKKIPKLFHDLL